MAVPGHLEQGNYGNMGGSSKDLHFPIQIGFHPGLWPSYLNSTKVSSFRKDCKATGKQEGEPMHQDAVGKLEKNASH